MNLLICDIDGILAQLTPEQKDLAENRATVYSKLSSDEFWVRYYDNIPKQKPIAKFEELLYQAFKSNGWMVVMLTGRCETYRPQTVGWLYKHFSFTSHFGMNNYYHRLIMRPVFDRRIAPLFKKDVAKNLFKKRRGSAIKLLYGKEILLYGKENITDIVAFEDDINVIEEYKKQGFIVFSDKDDLPEKLEELYKPVK